jgi:hypothetical protein
MWKQQELFNNKARQEFNNKLELIQNLNINIPFVTHVDVCQCLLELPFPRKPEPHLLEN